MSDEKINKNKDYNDVKDMRKVVLDFLGEKDVFVKKNKSGIDEKEKKIIQDRIKKIEENNKKSSMIKEAEFEVAEEYLANARKDLIDVNKIKKLDKLDDKDNKKIKNTLISAKKTKDTLNKNNKIKKAVKHKTRSARKKRIELKEKNSDGKYLNRIKIFFLVIFFVVVIYSLILICLATR